VLPVEIDPVVIWLNSFSQWPAVRALLELAIPCSGSYFLNYSIQLVTVISVGQLGETELGAVGVATMLANVSGIQIKFLLFASFSASFVSLLFSTKYWQVDARDKD
jgi:Na+-driven multidrug efflux pump